MTKWIGAIIIGYLAAENNWFVRLGEFKLCSNSTWNFAGKLAADILVLAALIWFRQEVETSSYLVLLKYSVVPFWVVYFCYRYIVSVPGVGTVLQWIGKHSMNIFLVHTFYRWIWCRDFIYGLKYDMLIILTLFVISVITSIALESLKKWIRWDKMIGRMEQRLMLHSAAQ